MEEVKKDEGREGPVSEQEENGEIKKTHMGLRKMVEGHGSGRCRPNGVGNCWVCGRWSNNTCNHARNQHDDEHLCIQLQIHPTQH